jgi:hypothetical protein
MKQLLFLFAALAIVAAVTSCEVKTEFLTGDSVELRFSTDTVAFDTVFVARGSATQIMKVYNDGDEPIMIDRISVAGETGVNFIFNVDGLRGPEAKDVVIWGNDSIFVFVEVEVDPTEPAQTSPFIAEDRLIFETGNAQESVVLLAFGQNAFYLNGFGRGQFFGISCDNGVATLPTALPTVIYGSVVIQNCILEALPGTRIYIHGGVQRNEDFPGSGFFNDGIIFTEATGSVRFLGTRENPVIIRTDRLEPDFETDPGKYRGLIFGAGSRGNRLENTHLLNSIAGITLDSAAEVSIENSVIAYSAGPAISAFEASVTVRNSLFHSNFGNAIQFIKGGRLLMEHTTIANYGVDASAMILTNFVCDDNNQNCVVSPMSATIRNSILSGSRRSELSLEDLTAGQVGAFGIRIENSVIRTDQAFLDFQEGLYANFYTENCINCYNLQQNDPLFVSISDDDYRLDSLSVARNIGAFLPGLPADLQGVLRDTDTPDAGALERVDR